MKKIIVLFLLLITANFPQEIEKQFQFAPAKYYGISIKGNIVYAMSDLGLLVLEMNPENKYVLLNTIEMSFPNPSYSLVSDNNLILVCSDTVKYYDITNSVHPQFINQWKFPLAMKKIVKFGNYYILHDNVKYFLVSIDNDSLRVILDIPNNGSFLAIDYPYLIKPVSPTLELYKISSGLEFYLEQVIEVTPFKNAVAGKGIVAYLRNIYLPPPTSYFEATTTVRSLTEPGFPVIHENTIGAMEGLTLKDVSKFFHSISSDNPSIFGVLNYSGNVFGYYSKTNVLHLDTTNTFFVLGQDFRKNDSIVRIYNNYYALALANKVIQHSSNKFYLLSNHDETNTFIKLDSLETEDTISVRDSIIIFRNKNSIKVYGVANDKFFFADSFTLSNSIKNYDYHGKYLVSFQSNYFEVLRRTGNLYTQMFIKGTQVRPKKSIMKDSMLFVIDKLNGVRIHNLNSSFPSQEKWIIPPRYGSSSFMITGDRLWLDETFKIFLYDISNLGNAPVLLDSLQYPGINIYEVLRTRSGVFLRGEYNGKSRLVKLSDEGDSLHIKYIVQFPVNLEQYALTESGKKLILTSSLYTFWIRDTSIVSGVDYTETGKAEEYSLEQNYPNPFNPKTVISYRLSVNSNVTLKIYDVLGNEVAELIQEEQRPGRYEVEFNGSRLPSGIYFYRLTAGAFTKTKKMVMVK